MKDSLILEYVRIYTESFPQKEQAEEQSELKGLINDLVLEKQDKGLSYEQAVESTLTELGNPKLLANKNQGKSDALLSGVYYHEFLRVLPMALIGGVAIMLLYTIVRVIFLHIQQEVLEPIATYSFLLAIAVFTLVVFVILERAKAPIKAQEWSVESLRSSIKAMSKPTLILGFVFGLFFLVIFMFLPNLLDSVTDLEFDFTSLMREWKVMWPFFIGLIVMYSVEFILKIIHPVYDKVTLLITIISNVVTVVLAGFIINELFSLTVSTNVIEYQFWTVVSTIGVFVIIMLFDTYDFYKKTKS